MCLGIGEVWAGGMWVGALLLGEALVGPRELGLDRGIESLGVREFRRRFGVLVFRVYGDWGFRA